MNRIQYLAIAGMLSPIVYLAAVVIGSILDPNYSQMQTVSEIIKRGAPNKVQLDALFVLHGVLLILFGYAIYLGVEQSIYSIVGFAFLILNGIFGLLLILFFPLDEGGKLASFTGVMHMAFAGLVSMCSLIAIFSLWLEF